MTREDVLANAKEAVCDRPNQYGKPENNFERIANLWNAHLFNRLAGYDELSSSDVAIMLALVKIARLENDATHMDSWIDLAGYAACGGEVAAAD